MNMATGMMVAAPLREAAGEEGGEPPLGEVQNDAYEPELQAAVDTIMQLRANSAGVRSEYD